MFDLLDILHGKLGKTMTGTFYKTKPYSPDDEGAVFDYEPVDPTTWHYQKLLENLQNSEFSNTTVKSNDDMDYAVGNFVVLQDEKLYKINSVVKDYVSAKREAFRYLKDVPDIDYILRLIEVENPWEIE